MSSRSVVVRLSTSSANSKTVPSGERGEMPPPPPQQQQQQQQQDQQETHKWGANLYESSHTAHTISNEKAAAALAQVTAAAAATMATEEDKDDGNTNSNNNNCVTSAFSPHSPSNCAEANTSQAGVGVSSSSPLGDDVLTATEGTIAGPYSSLSDGACGPAASSRPFVNVNGGEESEHGTGGGSESESQSSRGNNTDAAAAATAPTPSIMDSAPKKKISWKCGVCGYHVLAMDQDGNPLPFAVSAYGQLLPIQCSRCQLEHTSWTQAVPFDLHGDHANIRSTLSNNYVELRTSGGGITSAAAATDAITGSGCGTRESTASSRRGPTVESLRSSQHHRAVLEGRGGTGGENALSRLGLALSNDGAFSFTMPRAQQAPTRSMAYYCGRCSRRLLRVDADGELVAMDQDSEGRVLPITCPGCGELHNEWSIKPFAANNAKPVGPRLY